MMKFAKNYHLQHANSFYVGGFMWISVWSPVGIQHNWAIKDSPSRDSLGDGGGVVGK